MERYVALAYDASDAHQRSVVAASIARLLNLAEGWETALDVPGLRVLNKSPAVGTSKPCVLPECSGVIVGTLFRSNDAPSFVANPTPTSAESRRIVESGGRDLIKGWWGRYVAFLKNKRTDKLHIIRDPSGVLPCYRVEHCGVSIFFSNVEDCDQIGGIAFTFDWTNVLGILAGMTIQSGGTTLQQVSELRPGECLEQCGKQIQRLFLWNPITIASDAIEDRSTAISSLRRTVQTSVDAWTSRHPRLIHSLSGGLDSSILLGCMVRAPTKPSVVCMNHYTVAAEGDERRFARLAAKTAGVELIEHLADGRATKLDEALTATRSMAPAFYVLELLHGEFERDLSEQIGATALFQGGGGDSMFLQNGAQFTPADYVRRHGIRSKLLRIAHDAAQVTQKPLWSLLASGVGAKFLRKPRVQHPNDAPIKSRFISPGACEHAYRERSRFAHPLLGDTRAVPEGKLWHILLMSMAPEFTRPYKQFARPPIVFPLLSQPVHELCLRIPTYVMFKGGRDRALARKTFKDCVPSDIVRRRGKGAADRVSQDLVRSNTVFLKEILLDGVLAREQIVDRTALAKSFLDAQMLETSVCDDILMLFETEVFLQVWGSAAAKAAAAA